MAFAYPAHMMFQGPALCSAPVAVAMDAVFSREAAGAMLSFEPNCAFIEKTLKLVGTLAPGAVANFKSITVRVVPRSVRPESAGTGQTRDRDGHRGRTEVAPKKGGKASKL